MTSLSIGLGLYSPFLNKGPKYSDEVSQYFARLSTKPDDVQAPRYEALIDGLVADGIWAKGDALWVLAAPETGAARANLIKASTLLLAVSGPTFTAFKGYKGNGANAYIRTQFTPSTQGVNFVRDSASIGVWNLTDRVASSQAAYGASDGASKNSHAYLYYPPDQSYFRLNGPEGAGITNAAGKSNGFFLSNRSGASAREVYRNGVSMGSYPGSASTDPIALNMYLLCNNINGTGYTFTTDELAMFWIGGSLTSTEAANFHTHMSTYLTNVGAI